MLISTLAFTFLNVFVKSLHAFDVYQIVFFRAFGSLFFTVPFLIRHKISVLGNRKALLVLRSIFGLFSMTLFFMALKHISMGTAVSIRYIAPIFAALFALIFLKEKIKPIQWLFFLIAFSGVLILKGFGEVISSLGILYAFLSAVFVGLVYITIRKIGSNDHPVVIVNYFMVISTVIGGILSIKNWNNPVGYEWLIFLSLGVFGYVAQLFMTKAFQVEETNQIAPLKYLEVLFTTIMGLIWFNETYDIYIIIGMLVIITGLSLNMIVGRKKPS